MKFDPTNFVFINKAYEKLGKAQAESLFAKMQLLDRACEIRNMFCYQRKKAIACALEELYIQTTPPLVARLRWIY